MIVGSSLLSEVADVQVDGLPVQSVYWLTG
jgi:hypothetical protein